MAMSDGRATVTFIYSGHLSLCTNELHMTTIVNTFKRIGIRTRPFNRAALACASEYKRVKAGLKQSARVIIEESAFSKGARISSVAMADTQLSSRDAKLLACAAILVVLSQAFFVGKI